MATIAMIATNITLIMGVSIAKKINFIFAKNAELNKATKKNNYLIKIVILKNLISYI